jgi:thiol:disulfide interchange protein DsbD
MFEAARGGAGAWARLAQSAAAAAVVAVAVLAATVGSDRAPDTSASAAPASDAEAFTQAKLDGLLAADKPVFVNMTAAWCITCLVNERTALATQSVREVFAQKGVTYLKGDWTSRNPEISRMLEKFGRSGVPLYVLYAKGQDPVVLPQLLTESVVLEHLNRL